MFFIKKKFYKLLFIFTFFPFQVLANDPPETFAGLVNMIVGLLNPVIYLIASLTLLAFLWGIVEFISAAGDANKMESGKKKMIYGIIVLFVFFSIWGLVALVRNTFGL